MIESDVPLTLLGYGLLTDSGGPGRRRGGLGLWREWRIDSALAQFGLAGGEAAAASALYLIRDGRRETLPSKVTNLMLRKGDIVRLETSGGGGFGEPTKRIGEHVEHDVRLGYVSPEAAASSYGRRRIGTV